jgi:uncharacterized damage-inducible protein DinB
VNPMAKAFWMGLERSNDFIGYFTTGMEGSDWLEQTPGIPNPAIWILGHLAQSRARFLEMLTGETKHEAGWDELFGMGVELRDPSAYPSADACREVLEARLADLKSYLETATEEDLEGPPCVPSEYFKSKASVLSLLTHHEAHHSGVLSMIRRSLGNERLI